MSVEGGVGTRSMSVCVLKVKLKSVLPDGEGLEILWSSIDHSECGEHDKYEPKQVVPQRESRDVKRTTSETRNDTPIESDWKNPNVGLTTEDLVDDDIVWCSPDHEAEERKEWCNVRWEPSIAEVSTCYDKEEPVTTNSPSVGLAWVRLGVIVKRVHESTVDKLSWPDHCSWPNEKATSDTGQSETKSLSRHG